MAGVTITRDGVFADFMAGKRRDLGLTQTELASEVGRSRKWVSDVELGKTMPTLPAVLRVIHSQVYSYYRVRKGCFSSTYHPIPSAIVSEDTMM